MTKLLTPEAPGKTEFAKWEREVSPVMIMVGSRAVEATLGLSADPDAPYEYVVAEDVYREALEKGWEEKDGSLVNPEDNSRWMTRYGKTGSYEGLLERGRTTEDGVYAGLPDNYAVMQYDGDTPETAAIRQRLLNPELPPLELELMPREHALVLSLLEKVPGAEDDPMYAMVVQLATHALYTQFTLYGDPDIRQINQIVGSLETADKGVFATYHNGFELIKNLGALLQHMKNIGATVQETLNALLAAIYSDIVYGNGRKSKDNPKKYDEMLSANLLYSHARQLGCPRQRARRMRRAVINTRFNEKTRDQPGRRFPAIVDQAVVGEDLHVLECEGGAESTDAIAVEDLFSDRHPANRPLRQVMDRYNMWRCDTVEEYIEFISTHRYEPVDSPLGATLGETLLARRESSAGFHETYVPPETWSLGNIAMQYSNAVDIRKRNQEFQLAV